MSFIHHIHLIVPGEPVGQGAISYGKSGHGYYSNAKLLKPWREKVGAGARKAWGEHAPLAGPIKLDITVTVKKPASAPKRAATWPVTRYSGDLDHLLRAIGDSLTGVLYKDDSQIISVVIRKVYPGTGANSLPHPGAVIKLWGYATTADAADQAASGLALDWL